MPSPAGYRTFGVNLKEDVSWAPDPYIKCPYDVHTSSGHYHYAAQNMTYDNDGNLQYYFSEGIVANPTSYDFPYHDPDSSRRSTHYETGVRC